MSRKHQIPFMFSTHVFAFTADIETPSLADLAVGVIGADCRNFSQDAHFANPRGIKDQILIPRSSVFTNSEISKKALSQAETPISEGQYPPFGKWVKKSLEVLKIGSNLRSKK